MLVIRMQRTGRKGHAQFRVVVQDSRRTPTSGKVVALIGNYNPHTKETALNTEKASFYLEHGAQPTERVARLLQSEGVKLPAFVVLSDKKTGKLRNPEKLRRNQPKEVASEDQSDGDEATTEAPAEDVQAEVEAPSEEAPAEITEVEAAAEEPAAEATETTE